MANRRRLSQIQPLPSMPMLRFKVARIVSRHEQMKLAYHQLKSQINNGLLQAEEVFASLAIPLMKLVGLKTEEMAEEGRFTTVIFDRDLTHGSLKNGLTVESPFGVREGNPNDQISAFNAESYSSRATIVSKEFIEKQQTQLIQLVSLLKQIETHVNSSQDNMLQTLDSRHVSLHEIFQKAICHLSTLHGQNHDTFPATLKLLKVIYNIVGAVIGSVKDGVGDLMQELAERMCNPMVEYVKGLRDDMKNGECVRLLAMVGEMEREMTDVRRELDDARKRIKMAEEVKIEALCKLRETKERVRMKDHLNSLSEAKRGHIEAAFSDKLVGKEEDRAKDDKLLWEILKKKRQYQAPESPMGPKQLMHLKASTETRKSKRLSETQLISSAPVSYGRGLSPQTPCSNTRIPLGSSPSVAIQPVVSHRCRTP